MESSSLWNFSEFSPGKEKQSALEKIKKNSNNQTIKFVRKEQEREEQISLLHLRAINMHHWVN